MERDAREGHATGAGRTDVEHPTPVDECVDGRSHAQPRAAQHRGGETENLKPIIGRAVLKLAEGSSAVGRERGRHRHRQPRGQADQHPVLERIILDNLRAEEALEEDAERLAQKLASKSLGMDQRKIVEGIKQRLAKERGFTL